jgi:glyoxylase-like metal-dependent hydrolase (beta-lactamase superfamily II)
VAEASNDLLYAPDRVLADGEALEGGGFTLAALATPGHTMNHLAYALREERALFSGDHVMAWSTTIVAPPSGSMAAFMTSLDTLRTRADAIYWPGHGGPVTEPQRFVRALHHHRRQREHAILSRLRAGDRTVEAIVASIYERLDPRLARAAGLSVLAHLEDLCARGQVAVDRQPGLDARFMPAD